MAGYDRGNCTFADSFHGVDLRAIFHGMEREVDRRNRLLGLHCPHCIVEMRWVEPRRELSSLLLAVHVE